MDPSIPDPLEPTTLIDTTPLRGLRFALWDHHVPLIPARNLLYLYETRWVYVDEEAMDAHEVALLQRLIKDLGNGVFLN